MQMQSQLIIPVDGGVYKNKQWFYFTWGIESNTRIHNLLYLWIQGFGTFFYSDSEYYEGEWAADKRSGWGRQFYEDGSIYEGEWHDDKKNGRGMLRLCELNWNGWNLVTIKLTHV